MIGVVVDNRFVLFRFVLRRHRFFLLFDHFAVLGFQAPTNELERKVVLPVPREGLRVALVIVGQVTKIRHVRCTFKGLVVVLLPSRLACWSKQPR